MRSSLFNREWLLMLLSLTIWSAGERLGCSQGSEKALQVYFVDVEGGQATLFVTPEHQSLLIDTGWPGYDGRDADRIVAAAKAAGISKIDYVLITHFHTGPRRRRAATDRADSGGNIYRPRRQPRDHRRGHHRRWDAYQKVLATGKFKHIVAKPGEPFPSVA